MESLSRFHTPSFKPAARLCRGRPALTRTFNNASPKRRLTTQFKQLPAPIYLLCPSLRDSRRTGNNGPHIFVIAKNLSARLRVFRFP